MINARNEKKSSTTYNVSDHNINPDGVTVITCALQKLIDECSSNGGGEIVFPAGRYLTGTIYLKSNVHLRLNCGAVLLGSSDIDDYTTDTGINMYRCEPWMNRCLIFARDAQNIGICGQGVIDGQGSKENFPSALQEGYDRPMMIRLINCSRVRLRQVSLINAAAWCAAIIWCNDVLADGLTIDNVVNDNGDGLDFDGCVGVRVINCKFNNSDDSICLQTSDVNKPCYNIVISNCIMSSKWAAFRFGLMSCGDIRDVTISNCVIYDCKGSGFKIQMCEGAVIENISIQNIVIRNVARPIFVTLNSFRFSMMAPDELPAPGKLRHIRFDDIRIESDSSCYQSQKSFIAMVGIPDNPIEDVSLNNISFTAPGGCDMADVVTKSVPELTGLRPEDSEYGEFLPCYGIYARHVNGLKINHVQLDVKISDSRPAVVFENVKNVDVNSLNSMVNLKAHAAIWLDNVENGCFFDCRAANAANIFYVEGSGTKQLDFLNVLKLKNQQMYILKSDVAKSEITVKHI